MRFAIIFSSALTLSQLAHAQLIKKVEVGSYVLNATPQLRQAAGLFLRNSEQLVARDLAGKSITLSPQQVRSFKIGERQFVSTGGFILTNKYSDRYVAKAFAEQLDSGQVVLFRYRLLSDNPTDRSYIVYGSEDEKSIYLLQSATSPTVTPMQVRWTKKDADFQTALRPYLASRPDLLKLLAANALSPKQLPLIVHALNRSLPYEAGSK